MQFHVFVIYDKLKDILTIMEEEFRHPMEFETFFRHASRAVFTLSNISKWTVFTVASILKSACLDNNCSNK